MHSALVSVLLLSFSNAMQWSGLSDMFSDWSDRLTGSYNPTRNINSVDSEEYSRDEYLERNPRFSAGGEKEKTSSYFEWLFSSRYQDQHERCDLVENGSQFETARTSEGGSIPWTPMTARHAHYGTEKNSVTTEMTIDKTNFETTSRSILPATGGDNSLAGIDKTAIVKTKYGAVLGIATSLHRSYLGIPYAAPPVGPNRWKKAVPLQNWISGKVLDATKYGSHCMQLNTWGSSYFRDLMVGLKTTESEDCLNLNVFTPTKARIASLPGGKNTKLPVLFFIHGGMFTTGGASANIYNPENFVDRNDVVVVTCNYRMSIWGFLASTELMDDNDEVGNYGLTDVLAALKWVKDYIRAFGGDPNNISLVGHSAGAALINYLLITLATPEYRDFSFIQRAVLFSGATGTGLIRQLYNAENDVTIQPLFNKLAASVGCMEVPDRLACLRQVDSAELAKVGIKNDWAYHWGPVVDGQYIPAAPLEMARNGAILNIPILVTDCLDDGTIFSVGEPTVTEYDFLNLIQKYFGSKAAPVIADLYGPTASCDGTPYFQAASLLLRDALISCPLDEFAGTLAESPTTQPIYYFRFLKPLSVAWLVGALPGVLDYGVFHGTELILLFQGLSQLTIGQAHAVNHVQRRIMAFLNGSKPNDPKYPTENPAVIIKGKTGINEVCSEWSRFPLSPEFLEIKMGLIGPQGDSSAYNTDASSITYNSVFKKTAVADK